AEATVGEFSIGFDASRVTDTASGFFVADTLDDPLGLEVLFDLSAPGTASVMNEELEISGADLLVSPELAGALGMADLAGADVGDARIDAMVMATGGEPAPDTMGTDGDDMLVGSSAADVLNGMGGDDMYTGGAGADSFVFSIAQGVDTITDFEVGSDRIELSGLTAEGVRTLEVASDTMVLTNSNQLIGVVQGVAGLDNAVFV
ncbi:MAG: M10 family metallopeptidase C-terminal domain-containing protein, partial [Cyanobacteria bacterium P01_A01_bin.135]